MPSHRGNDLLHPNLTAGIPHSASTRHPPIAARPGLKDAMSQKITAKNLQYNSNLPPFLARLRGQNVSERDPDAPDPILAARRRPGKKRSGSEEAEDAPLVLDEHGNAVDVTVSADGTVKEKESTSAGTEAQDQQAPPPGPGTGADATSTEKVAAIGEQRKRKIGKVIGGGDADEEDARTREDAKAGKSKRSATAAKGPKQTDEAAKAKATKKAKKVKLSFGDDEG